MKKLILTDADGVLLDWHVKFDQWMQRQGYVPVENHTQYYSIGDQYKLPKDEAKRLTFTFNQSASMGFLPALRNSRYYVRRLHEEFGYTFHVITSQTSDPDAQELRKQNLKNLFGADVFDGFTILGCGDDKTEALMPYKNSGLHWIEDKPENALVGKSLGLRSILIEHNHNFGYADRLRVVQCWAEIYQNLKEYN
jgi:hypothetical protein